MVKFKDYLIDDILNEVLITVGKSPYPQFGNVVILAGGSASGKGFVKDKLLALEGVNCDVDALKELALKSTLIAKEAKIKYGIEFKDMNLRNPDDVSRLHSMMVDMKIIDKHKVALYTSILVTDEERKPNIIFDVTLKDITKLINLTSDLNTLGYSKDKIHVVWVVNDVKVALEQNRNRKRVVNDDIVIDTHEGASLTMKKIIDMGDRLKAYLDGSIILAFNNKNAGDSGIAKSDNGGMYVTKSNYIVIKNPGQPVDQDKLTDDVVSKIKDYTPKINVW